MKRAVRFAAPVALTASVVSQSAYSDFYIKLDDIQGESQSSAYPGWVDVLAWSWGAVNSGTTHLGGGAGSGRVSFDDLTFVKYLDQTTPELIRRVATGQSFPRVDFVVTEPTGKTPLEVLRIELEDVLVTQVEQGGREGQVGQLTESITLNFARFTVTQRTFDDVGTKTGESSFSFDIPQNTEQ